MNNAQQKSFRHKYLFCDVTTHWLLSAKVHIFNPNFLLNILFADFCMSHYMMSPHMSSPKLENKQIELKLLTSCQWCLAW